MTAIEKIEGIFAALITPFDATEALAPERAQGLIDRLIETGVHGFYVGGSTGEGFLQTVGERCEYMRYVADVTGRRATLIAQVGALASRDVWQLAECAADSKYDYVSSTPPFYYSYSNTDIVAYYHELAERSPLPVLLYNAPHTTGRNLSIDVQTELLRLPNVVGSKHTDSNLFVAERLIRLVEGTNILNGPDEMLTAALAMGLTSGVGTTYNLMPRHYLNIYDNVRNGDLAAARASQAIVNEVIHELLTISPSVIPGVKLGLEILGFDVGRARKPFQPVDADTRRYESLLLQCNGM